MSGASLVGGLGPNVSCILQLLLDLFHSDSRQLQRLVLHCLPVFAASGLLSIADMIASAVYWDVYIQNHVAELRLPVLRWGK